MEINNQLGIRTVSLDKVKKNESQNYTNGKGFENVLGKVNAKTQKDSKVENSKSNNENKNVTKDTSEKGTDKVQSDNKQDSKVKENGNSKISKGGSKTENDGKEKVIDDAKEKGIIPEKIAESLKENKDEFSLEELIAALSALSSGKIEVKDLMKNEIEPQKIDEVIAKVQKVIDEAFAKFNKGEIKNVETKQDFVNYLKSEIVSAVKDNVPENLKGKVSEFLEGFKQIPEENFVAPTVLKEQVTPLINKHFNKETLKNLSKNDDIVSQIKQKLNEVNTNGEVEINPINSENHTETNNESFSMEKEAEHIEDNFLKNLVSDDKDTKINKATVFMNLINNRKSENVEIPTDKVVINRETFAADVIKSVKFMALNNMKELTVKIMPKELGEVIIKVNMEGGAMKASVTASNKEAYNILNSNLQDITSKLENTNIKIQNFTIDIYNGDTTFFKEGSKNNSDENNKKSGKKNKGIDAIDGEDFTPQNLSEVENSIDMLG